MTTTLTVTRTPLSPEPKPLDPARLYRYERTARVVPSPADVTEADIAAYHRDGFLAVAGVLSPEEIASGKEALADLIHGCVPGYEGLQPEPEFSDRWPAMTAAERADTIRKVWRFIEFEPRLKALAVAQETVQTLLARLTGEPCNLIQDMALLKPPHVGTEKPWHQDMAYFAWGPPEKILGVWIALDPATEENGCMHVLPGTQDEGPVPHIHLRDCQIPDDDVQIARDVTVPLAPGGALLFHSLLHHGTPPNHSASRRWALQYHYAAQSCRPVDRMEHAGMYFDGELYAGCRGKRVPVSELTP